jgi:hypothetical protein
MGAISGRALMKKTMLALALLFMATVAIAD